MLEEVKTFPIKLLTAEECLVAFIRLALLISDFMNGATRQPEASEAVLTITL